MVTYTSARMREQASHLTQTTQAYEDGPGEQTIEELEPTNGLEQKIEALAEIICSAGEEYAGALFVLMGMLEHSEHPEVIANTAKHLAFTRCGEFNLFGMVDAQIAVVEGELLPQGKRVTSLIEWLGVLESKLQGLLAFLEKRLRLAKGL